jgi:methylenetetrahydrofolate reductase (NADPH)
VADEGLAMCAEIIQQILRIPGVSGVHVMAPGFEHGIPEVLARAGLARAATDRPGQAEPATAGAARSARAAGTAGTGGGSGHAH